MAVRWSRRASLEWQAGYPWIRLPTIVFNLAPTGPKAGTVRTDHAGGHSEAAHCAVISTTSGSGGLGLLHGHSAWIADTPEAFAAGVATLIADPERRRQIARAAYLHAVRNYNWETIGEKQRDLIRGLL